MRSPSPSATFIGWACRARARAPSTRPVPRAAPPAGAHSDCRADRMIAHLRGRLLEKHPNRVIVDVQGVGYEAHVPLSTFYGLAEPGSDITLRIHTHVREDVLALYGFATLLEQQVFERLITVNGIGHKLGLAILSGIESKDLISAIRLGDVARLTGVP